MKVCANCNSCQTLVGWVCLIASLLVTIFTLFIGIMNNSKALMAVSLCSGIDIASALTVILGMKLANKSLDLEHPYGHGKVEFIVVSGLSLLLIISAIVLFVNSVQSIYLQEKGPDQWLTLVAGLVLAGMNWIKYKYVKCVGFHFNSPAIKTLADHSKVDAISSAAVVIGVIFAKLGWHFVDPLIAIFEIGHIVLVSSQMLSGSINSLMDVSIPQADIRSLRKIVHEVNGVMDIGYLHARQIGRDLWVELSIIVDPDISVFNGKEIAGKVQESLSLKKEHIGNVQVQFLSKIKDSVATT